MKYEVGDEVKITKIGGHFFEIGYEGRISDIDERNAFGEFYQIDRKDGGWVKEDQITFNPNRKFLKATIVFKNYGKGKNRIILINAANNIALASFGEKDTEFKVLHELLKT